MKAFLDYVYVISNKKQHNKYHFEEICYGNKSYCETVISEKLNKKNLIVLSLETYKKYDTTSVLLIRRNIDFYLWRFI